MTKFQIEKKKFGKLPNAKTVDSYTLKNDSGMSISILTYGGIVYSLEVPDCQGRVENIVLGHKDLTGYMEDTHYLGCIVGRCANRIEKGRFKLNRKTYHLSQNHQDHHIHGGEQGFNKKLWRVTSFKESDHAGLKLFYKSKDMEEGYPGNVSVTVTYTLTNDNTWYIDYHAVTDQETIVNLTQHSYFNLAGNGSKDCLSHKISISARQYTPLNSDLLPVGEIRPVTETSFDLLRPVEIGNQMDFSCDQIQNAGGYDLNFVFDKDRDMNIPVVSVTDPKTGRCMEVYTTQPCIQFYTGNSLDIRSKCRIQKGFNRHQAFCLETQGFPNAANHEGFPSVFLKPGDIYQHRTIYKFGSLPI